MHEYKDERENEEERINNNEECKNDNRVCLKRTVFKLSFPCDEYCVGSHFK